MSLPAEPAGDPAADPAGDPAAKPAVAAPCVAPAPAAELERLDPAWPRVCRLVTSITIGVLLFAGWTTLGILALLGGLGLTHALYGAALALGAAFVARLCAARYIRLDYLRSAYALTSAGLEIRRGVVWRSTLRVPRNRVQYTDLTRGPIERRHGLATLVVHTAGTVHAVVALSGLGAERAATLRDALLAPAPGATSASSDDDAV